MAVVSSELGGTYPGDSHTSGGEHCMHEAGQTLLFVSLQLY